VSAKPTIIVLARQVGAANAFVPLIRELAAREPEFGLVLFGVSHAYWTWRDNGLLPIEVQAFAEALPCLAEIGDPRFLLTGTSASAWDDSRFWDWARKRSIPSLAFVDSWIGYGRRFSSHPQSSRLFDCLPDKIAVIDEVAAEGMQKAGCPPELLIVTGHPGFDDLPDLRGLMDFSLRKKIAPSDIDRFVLFVSTPHLEARGPQGDQVLTYTETEALELTISVLEELGRERMERIFLAVKPHPREGTAGFQLFLASHRVLEWVNFRLVDKEDSYALVASADLVVGMSSVLLYEASLMGRPVVSIRTSRRQEDDTVDCHRGIRVALNREQALNSLREILVSEPGGGGEEVKPASRNATGNFVSYILEKSGRFGVKPGSGISGPKGPRFLT